MAKYLQTFSKDVEFTLFPQINDANNTVNDVVSMLDNLKLATGPSTPSVVATSRLFGLGARCEELDSCIFPGIDIGRIVALWDQSRGYSKLLVKEHNNVESLQYNLYSPTEFLANHDGKSVYQDHTGFGHGDNVVKLWDRTCKGLEKRPVLKDQMGNFKFNYSQDFSLLMLNENAELIHSVPHSKNVEIVKTREYFRKYLFKNSYNILNNQNDKTQCTLDSETDFEEPLDTVSWRRAGEVVPVSNIKIRPSTLKRRSEDTSLDSKKVITFCTRCQQISVNGICNNICHNLKRKLCDTLENSNTKKSDIKLEPIKVRKITSDVTTNEPTSCVGLDLGSRIRKNCFKEINVMNRKRKNTWNESSTACVKIPKLHHLKLQFVQSSVVI